MTRFSLRARWIVPVEGEPISGGLVTIDDGTIVAFNDRSFLLGPVEDLGDVVLLPGFVNAHTHLEFSDLQQPLGKPGMALPDWIRLVIGDRKRSTRSLASNVAAGLQESLSHGVTAIGDIATTASQPRPMLPHTLSFQEVIGFSAGRVDSALTEVIERVQLSEAAGISPHAPYTVHPRLLEKLVDEAIEQDLPMAMHLAESREELELLSFGTGPFRDLLNERSMWDEKAISSGTTALDYLKTLSRAPRSLVVHGNYLAETEIEHLASHRQRMSVVYCPRTHEYFGHEPYPLRRMLDAGVRVALGTDSRASSPDLSLHDEVRHAAEAHHLAPDEAIYLGTQAGAESLGLQDTSGSIAVGKRANLVALLCPSDDPCAAALEHAGPPSQVWLGGKKIRDGN